MEISSYERIKKYVPDFYSSVKEMDAIYKVDGKMIDELKQDISKVKANRFINSADEKTITERESFLEIEIDENSNIESRKKYLISSNAGFGKMSATVIKNIIKSMTGAETIVTFSAADKAGNNRLKISIINPKLGYSLENVVNLLQKRIPAQLWFEVDVSKKKTRKIYIGAGVQYGGKIHAIFEQENIENYTWLTDERGNYLTDENGLILFV